MSLGLVRGYTQHLRSPSPGMGRTDPLDRGLVADYRFDPATGNKLVDYSGRGNHGDIVGPAWTSAKRGPMLFFDDTNDYVTFGDVLDIGTSDWSYEIVFRADWVAANEFHSLITKSKAAGGLGRWFLIFEAGNLYCMLETSVGVKTASVAEGAYLDGALHHAMVTIDRDGLMVLYVDSNSVASVDVSGGAADDYDTAFPLGLGAYPNAAGLAFTQGWFDGLLGPASVWARNLTPPEVRARYQMCLARATLRGSPSLWYMPWGKVAAAPAGLIMPILSDRGVHSIVLGGQIVR